MRATLALLVLTGCPLTDKADTSADSTPAEEEESTGGFDPEDPWLLLLGDSLGDEFGAHAAPLGDIDGDGNPEIAVAAPGAQRAYVFFSRTVGHGGVFHAADADVTFVSDLPIVPGAEVADAGDVDGDGLSDLLVRCTDFRRQAQVSLFFGSGLASGGDRSIATADAQIGAFDGDTYASDLSGALVGAGDVDGDGLDDVWIGSTELGNGRLFRVSGSVLQYGGTIELTDHPSIRGRDSNARLGGAASAGDIDGDGVNDVLVVAPREWGVAEAWVVYSTTFLAEEEVGQAEADVVLTYPLRDAPERTTGLPVRVGDLDVDGLADLILGEPRWFSGRYDTGVDWDTGFRNPSGRVSIFYAADLEAALAVNDADAQIEGARTVAFGRRLGQPGELTSGSWLDLPVSSDWDAYGFDGTTLPSGAVIPSSDAWADWALEGVKAIDTLDLAGDGNLDLMIGGHARPYEETGWVMVLAE